jgi:hypothetical protein
MKATRILVSLGLMALVPLSFTACGGDTEESSQGSDDEAAEQTEQGLGSEDPWPGPGRLPPGGHDPGGPGYGWGSGFAGDPQYAPYTSQRDPDPYRDQRHAKQREYDRIHDENQRHAAAGRAIDEARARAGEGEPSTGRLYGGGWTIPAPPSPRWTWGPLNDKGRCQEMCFKKYNDDMDYCARLPDGLRGSCRRKAAEDYALCVRDCSRKYPDPRLPKDD